MAKRIKKYELKNATKEELKEEEKIERETIRANFIPIARRDNMIMAKELIKDVNLLKKEKNIVVNRITTAVDLSKKLNLELLNIDKVSNKIFVKVKVISI